VGVRLETANGVPDAVKWVAAAVLLAAGVWGFYFFAEQHLLLRVVGVLAAVGAGAFVAFQTERGRIAWRMVQEARTEVRKVVWPTRKETVQTTGIVLAMVTLVACILWLFDTFLGWVLRQFLQQGG